MILGFDLDEPLADMFTTFIMYHNAFHGTNYTRDDWTSYSFMDFMGDESEVVYDKIKHYFTTSYFKNMKPTAGAVEGVKKLRNNNQLYVITARMLMVEDETKEWVEHYYPKFFSGIYLTNQGDIKGPKKDKSYYCQLLGIESFVDDAYHNILDVAPVIKSALIWDELHNRNVILPKNVSRAFDWNDILKYWG